jgi:nucleoside-diphosphate-sugar epimerase
MLRIAIIGGTGHVGTYLVPRLVNGGHEVISISRGESRPYRNHPAWKSVEHVRLDRAAEEAAGDFAQRVRSLRPDAVVDMICFEVESARLLVEALKGSVRHFLHCGTIWVHGHSIQVPTTEEQPRHPFGEYGTKKAEIEEYLLDEARRNGFPATVLHPGHIVGAGWVPVNPAGTRVHAPPLSTLAIHLHLREHRGRDQRTDNASNAARIPHGFLRPRD